MTIKQMKSLFIGIAILFWSSSSIAWDNERTHRDLSLRASELSSIGTGAVLETLDLKGALKHALILNGKTKQIIEWLQEGAKLEDAGTNWQAFTGKARFNNHFHNPLKDWDKAGLDDSVTILVPSIPPYVIRYNSSGESALNWAQDKANQQSYSESNGLEGDQTWQTIRDYYYNALTGKTDSERQAYFARTFKGLGHQMHLIQDMAVPAHVRNDAHPEDALLGSNYITGDLYFETYAKNRVGLINDLASNPVFPQVDLTKSPVGKVPITQFYDTDQYNENVVPTKSLAWGLSEYTNANFISDDTIFTENLDKGDRHYFPYPRYTDQTQCYEQFEEKIDLGTSKTRTYWRKKCVGEPVDHFVTVGALFKYLPTWDLQRLSINLDERTHYDYVRNLIPRAVGYSAGLLNYFFRGEIDMVPDDATGSGYLIVNNTDEDMTGAFELFYDKANDERAKVELSDSNFSIGKKSSGSYKSTNITFTPPSNSKEPGKYMLVFRGKLGSEEDAVVAKSVELKDGDYLFLVNLKNQTAAYEIRVVNTQYQMIPVSKNINLTHFGRPSTALIVQSHPNKKEHKVALPWYSLNPDGSMGRSTYSSNLEKYGGLYDDYNFQDYLGNPLKVLRGFPNAYIPEKFDEGSPFMWDSGLVYGEWTTKIGSSYGPRFASYIHGRRPFSTADNKLTGRNISIRKNDVYTYDGNDYFGPFHIQYVDELGNWVRGADLPREGGQSSHSGQELWIGCGEPVKISSSNCERGVVHVTKSCDTVPGLPDTESWPNTVNYLAVLDETNTIHTINNSSSNYEAKLGVGGKIRSHSESSETFISHGITGSTCEATITQTTDTAELYQEISGVDTTVSTTELVVGDNTLEEFRMSRSEKNGQIGYFGFNSDIVVEYSDCHCSKYQEEYRERTSSHSYTMEGKTATTTINGQPATGFCTGGEFISSGTTFGSIMDYDHMYEDKYHIIFYQYTEENLDSNWEELDGPGLIGTGEGATISEDLNLTLSSHSYRETMTKYRFAYKIDNLLMKVDVDATTRNVSESSSGEASVSTLAGERVTGVSSQINDKNMVYTYIVERYDGNKWGFNRRIVGIVNVADNSLPVGYRQEFEINFLGLNYDPSWLAAIGVTK